jgi:hypothetical protein
MKAQVTLTAAQSCTLLHVEIKKIFFEVKICCFFCQKTPGFSFLFWCFLVIEQIGTEITFLYTTQEFNLQIFYLPYAKMIASGGVEAAPRSDERLSPHFTICSISRTAMSAWL